MAMHLSSFFHFLVLLISIVHFMVVGDACSHLVPGLCSVSEDCNQRCKSLHHRDALIGVCSNKLCTCYYKCQPSPVKRTCHAADIGGLCESRDACMAKCRVFPQGGGVCIWNLDVNVCLCGYPC